MRRIIPIILSSIAIYLSPAQAQNAWYGSAGDASVYGYGYGGYGYGGYGSSTLTEGAYRGFADALRARGEAARSTSEAMINYEEARGRYIDNKLKWTETYYARRRLFFAEREKDRAEKREARERYLERKRTQSGPRLSPGEFDAVTGYIDWPEALMSGIFAEDREKVQELFLLRSYTKTRPELTQSIQETLRRMEADLRQQIRDLKPHQYIAARRFLTGLIYENVRLSR